MFLQLHGLFEDIIPAESFAWGAARFCCWVVVDVLGRWRWTYRRASSAGSAAVGKLKYENKVFGCCVCGAAEGVSECVNTLDRRPEVIHCGTSSNVQTTWILYRLHLLKAPWPNGQITAGSCCVLFKDSVLFILIHVILHPPDTSCELWARPLCFLSLNWKLILFLRATDTTSHCSPSRHFSSPF